MFSPAGFARCPPIQSDSPSAVRVTPPARYHCNDASRRSPHGELAQLTVAPCVFAFSHRKSGRLNADVTVTALTSSSQALRHFGDARVVLKDILHLNSDKSVPGTPSRHGLTTRFTDDFWNVRHMLHHCRQQRSSECCSRVPLRRTLVRR